MKQIQIIFSLIFAIVIDGKIHWNGNDWAPGCTFQKTGRDLSRLTTSASQCGPKCFETARCTHYIWHDGTCFLRHGEVSKGDATATTDQKQVCGVWEYRGIKGECVSWNKNTWAPACDFSSENDMFQVESTGGECFSRCNQTSGCTHFSWTPNSISNPSGNGKCQMKKGSITRFDAFYTGDQSGVCGVVKSASPDNNAGTCWNRKNWAAHCEFQGPNLASLPGVAGEQCSARCIVNEKCTHYSWSKNVCYLKQGTLSKRDAVPVAESSSICGMVPNEDDPSKSSGIFWNGRKWSMECAFRGRDLTSLTNVEGKFCSSKCAENDKCTHFNWSPENGGTCSLKHGSVSRSNAYITGDKTIACGYLKSFDDSSNDLPLELGPKVDYKPSSSSRMFMGVCYDPMHNKEYPLNGETPDSDALRKAIDKDFSHISKYFKHVRTFYSTFYDAPVTPYAAKHGVKLYLGVYMTDEAWYQNQIDEAVSAVKHYPETVLAILVGNENLKPNGPHSADDIIGKINQLRDMITKSTGRSVLIGTVQRVNEWLSKEISSETSRLADACDIIGVNIYPFFGEYDYKNPIQPLHQHWHAMITRYGATKVRLTETGFPSAGGRSLTGVQADLKTEIAYYNAVTNWRPDKGEGPAFWFAFHDRRSDDNSVPGEFEKHFGLFKADGTPKADNFPSSGENNDVEDPSKPDEPSNIEDGDKNSKNKLFAIAHMVNNPNAIDWAVGSGANAIEFDINFDKNSGDATNFRHGLPCDCTCIFELYKSDSVCQFRDTCYGVEHDARTLMHHVANKHPNLPLVYFDSKTSKLSSSVQEEAGKKIVDLIVSHLFKKGYNGQVLIGSGKEKTYIKSAAKHASQSAYKSRFFFTLDQDRSGVDSTLTFLTSLETDNIVYSTGISICSSKKFDSEIETAAVNRNNGLISNVFIWTLDVEDSFKLYHSAGARGILTNKPRKLVTWAQKNGIKLAKLNDGSLSPATSKSIEDMGDCKCRYDGKGCKITNASSANKACKCMVKIGVKKSLSCTSKIVSCADPDSDYCKKPDTGPQSCAQGGGDCSGYGSDNCDCDYHPGGCSISKAPPKETACKCIYKGAWTCKGEIVKCSDAESDHCKTPDTSVHSCILGGGDCGGYGEKGCDCDYHKGGCSISTSAPSNTACKCVYKGGWTCGGQVVRCLNEQSAKCSSPDKSIESCVLGGGDCEGYKDKSCDCSYKKGGCKITRAPPANTACNCKYKKLAWTCTGDITRCSDEQSDYCKNPDTSLNTCVQGGGDCGGYR